MRKFKKIVTYILAFVLTIATIGFLVVNLLSSTIMNEKYVLSKLEEIDYYNKLSQSVQLNFEKYIQQSGLDEEVIKDIVTKEKIEKDTKQIINNLYDGLNEKISTDEIAKNLETNIKKSLHGRSLSENEEEAVSKFIQKICNEYESTILHTKYEKTINEYYSKITKFTKLAIKITSITIGVCIIAMILINIRRIYRTINGIGISLLSSGAILYFANIYINSKVKVGTITILNEMFSTLIRKVIGEILQNIGMYGLVFAIVGIVLIVLSNLMHNILKYGLEEKQK